MALAAALSVTGPAVAADSDQHDHGRGGLKVTGLTDDQQLVSFRTGEPDRVSTAGAVTGLAGDTALVGIDYRVQDGLLYGVGNAGGVYTLDTYSPSPSDLLLPNEQPLCPFEVHGQVVRRCAHRRPGRVESGMAVTRVGTLVHRRHGAQGLKLRTRLRRGRWLGERQPRNRGSRSSAVARAASLPPVFGGGSRPERSARSARSH
ncbi:DUF4394 domain-containing protein [Streptomyces sp. NPDC002886]|uniref:DUF4394 domain-containing protein n=1 Tax=Streptomyces sp. NPDC002886 TaxID=3364667 RepID=UPI00368752F5